MPFGAFRARFSPCLFSPCLRSSATASNRCNRPGISLAHKLGRTDPASASPEKCREPFDLRKVFLRLEVSHACRQETTLESRGRPIRHYCNSSVGYRDRRWLLDRLPRQRGVSVDEYADR